MFWKKVRLCVMAYLVGRYQHKAERNRKKGLQLMEKGVLLTSPKLIRRNHKTSDYGYRAKYYEAEFLESMHTLSLISGEKEACSQRAI